MKLALLIIKCLLRPQMYFKNCFAENHTELYLSAARLFSYRSTYQILNLLLVSCDVVIPVGMDAVD